MASFLKSPKGNIKYVEYAGDASAILAILFLIISSTTNYWRSVAVNSTILHTGLYYTCYHHNDICTYIDWSDITETGVVNTELNLIRTARALLIISGIFVAFAVIIGGYSYCVDASRRRKPLLLQGLCCAISGVLCVLGGGIYAAANAHAAYAYELDWSFDLCIAAGTFLGLAGLIIGIVGRQVRQTAVAPAENRGGTTTVVIVEQPTTIHAY